MKKSLPTEAIANELSNASVFFPSHLSKPDSTVVPATATAKSQDSVGYEQPIEQKPIESTIFSAPIESKPSNVAGNRDRKPPRQHDTMPPSNHHAMIPANDDAITSLLVETIRKTVKQIGKEAATHRFTEEEKRALADIVYTYERQGYRTSENEITRIAVNWLILDYQQFAANSLLARLLESLHR